MLRPTACAVLTICEAQHGPLFRSKAVWLREGSPSVWSSEERPPIHVQEESAFESKGMRVCASVSRSGRAVYLSNEYMWHVPSNLECACVEAFGDIYVLAFVSISHYSVCCPVRCLSNSTEP